MNKIAQFNRFEIELTEDQVYTVYHQGDCYDDSVAVLNELGGLKRVRRS